MIAALKRRLKFLARDLKHSFITKSDSDQPCSSIDSRDGLACQPLDSLQLQSLNSLMGARKTSLESALGQAQTENLANVTLEEISEGGSEVGSSDADSNEMCNGCSN